jgi:LysM repeat protein
MPTDKPTSPTKICPTCGTRIPVDAPKCLVCGADLGTPEKPAQPAKAVQASRMPEISLSLPVVILLMALFLAIGAVIVYFGLRTTPEVILPPTETVTPTITLTQTLTPTSPPPTTTFTPAPSPTPVTYLVKENDTCIGIAAFFGVSVQSIVTLNNLPAACNTLYINQPLLIPQATATPTSLPSATFSVAEQTEAACEKDTYIVKANDTLSTISAAYGIPMAAISEYNGLTNNTVYEGSTLIIPLCKRFATPGPSPTATLPPPYPAPNLLLPTNGSSFTLVNDTITLQWAAVGILREDESYEVEILDLTDGETKVLVDYVTDTKYIVPSTIRPKSSAPHLFQWKIRVVRQSTPDSSGNPTWVSAGTDSLPRMFIWVGAGGAATPTP